MHSTFDCKACKIHRRRLAMSTGMTSTPTRKLRILCFHGYLQNPQVTVALGYAVPHDYLFCTAVQPDSDLQIVKNQKPCRSFRGR